jgi:hypothetical protein
MDEFGESRNRNSGGPSQEGFRPEVTMGSKHSVGAGKHRRLLRFVGPYEAARPDLGLHVLGSVSEFQQRWFVPSAHVFVRQTR